MKKNIYLVQVDILRKLPTGGSTAYLPYSAGTLWAYAKQTPAINERYDLREILFIREAVSAAAARIQAPFLVGFSCYCWNTEYNKALAQAVKRAFPACHILFGGHNVPPGGTMLEELPYVDFLVHGEGELPFQALLEELAKDTPDFTAVPGLSCKTNHGTQTNAEICAASVAAFPSPYLEGVFDPIIAAHPQIGWSTVWETNRGCPHHCAYCDWGQQKAKVRQFPMERLLAEIEWFGNNTVEYIYCADANFGILPRDEEIVDALAAAKKRNGNPRLMNYNTSKVLDERLFRIAEKLSRSGLDRVGPNFAMQSLSPEVLQNIGRRNIDGETLSRWIRRCHQAGYRAHTDLILGLPGETLESFCAGVDTLYRRGQHEGIQCFPCNLLPNALMATPDYLRKYQIKTTRRIYKQTLEDTPESERISEYMDVIIETVDMPHEDWLTANSFMLLAQSVHGYGLLRLAAMLLHTKQLVSYADFYMRLLRFCREHPKSLPGEAMARMRQNFEDMTHGREAAPLEIPGFGFGRMFEDQYFFGRAVLEPDRFYADAAVFLRQFDLEPALLSQLLRYQRESILMPGAAEKILDFDYDFPAYFSALYDGLPAALQKKPVRLRFSFKPDLSSMTKYYDTIVQLGRYTSNAFYQIEKTDMEHLCT